MAFAFRLYQFEYPPHRVPAYGLARLTATRMQFFLVNAVTLAAYAAFALWQLGRALRALGRPESGCFSSPPRRA